ncbi:M20 aminoacylase family protein [Neisseria perflava]|uniref:M20 aminoacylase family protein n=1 Tax=Neisseria perflava TaxID=33053 RepID=UPI00209CADA0|nr:M20 aminoacylase family protein [Neisseria perflava]MCP1660700.1 hippurate hydrolase [Neisseria perflava]MCP1773071.1 hippurate hydrolase [Neisseria perflava]
MPTHLEALQQRAAFFTDIRRQIHRHPELGHEEQNTSDLVAKLLAEWGYEVHRGLAKTGVVGTLKCGDGGKSIGLRADLDALPIQEENHSEWRSQTDGKFHGCGHDGHTTALLAAAERLAQTRNFNGTLHVIFQPAEELLSGGQVMIADGLFEQFPCDAIFGMHNMPKLNKGEFYFCEEPAMASSDTLHIHVQGVGSHGAMPEHGVDATLTACHIAIALQSIVSRNVSPLDQAVITVGCIQSGDAANVVNGKALMKLSVRALKPETRARLLRRIEEVAQAQAQSFGATATVERIIGCPPLLNSIEMTRFAAKVAQETFGADKVHTDQPPLMGSEDFSFMLEANPNGNYCFIGNGGGENAYMVHHPLYDFNDEILVPAAAYWCAITEAYLK